ncbi:MAG: tRNA pseudouridine(55) synthase TruB, partial [Alphaproteobacteria bacterium]|nr:tRNA pseudouridine(55) synthase TruB [Alphaproteobacteria bacterium]
VLPIALGEATKTISFAQDRHKTYRFTITWGERRSTGDSEGEVIETSAIRPSPQAIEAALPEFIGYISQTPPIYSAIKVDGRRSYDLAREGETPELAPREIYIDSLALTNHTPDNATFVMNCGKGTYVRALAVDLAERLGTVGYISALRRTEVGPFTLENTISLDRLEEIVQSVASITDVLEGVLLPLETALDDIPALAIKEEETARLRNGQALSFVSRPDFERLQKTGIEPYGTALALFQSRPVALVQAEGPQIKPVRVFNL